MSILELSDIHRNFTTGSKVLEILRGVNLKVDKGEVVALVGASGSGKSTMLQIAGLLDQATSGSIIIDGEKVKGLTDQKRSAIRQNKIGFIYQFHHLLPDFTALENVAMPLRIAGATQSEATATATDMLEELGLSERMDHFPSALSGGEQQRVAIARALIGTPKLLLADEPTGNLDWETADRVMDMLLAEVSKRGLSAVIVTHDRDLAARMDRTVTLHEGMVEQI